MRVSTASGHLVIEPGRKRLRALARRLREERGVVVRIFDADGHMVMDSAGPASPSAADPVACRRLVEETRNGAQDRAPRDNPTPLHRPDATVVPIERSSVYFGTLVACPSGDDAQLEAESTDATLDTMRNILAEHSTADVKLEDELALRNAELELLYDIDEKLRLREHTANALDYVAGKALATSRCSCLVWVPGDAAGRQDESRVFWNTPVFGTVPMMVRLEAEQLAHAVAARVRAAGEPLAMAGLDADPDLNTLIPQLNAVLGVPLELEGDVYGCFVVFKPADGPFTDRDLRLLGVLARKAALVFRDSHLVENIDSLFFSLIRLLVTTIENKDQYTKGHSQRVKTFTVRLAELMALPRSERDVLHVSGLLHDVGKQGIPDAVLKKEGALTDEERSLINTHPARGVDLLKHIRQFEKSLPHIRHHHERFDGKGYPDGLKGQEIPQGARIIAVADTYDALTSDRCYRSRYSPEEAFEIVEQVAGTQLDPEGARHLLENRDEFGLYSLRAQLMENEALVPLPSV